MEKQPSEHFWQGSYRRSRIVRIRLDSICVGCELLLLSCYISIISQNYSLWNSCAEELAVSTQSIVFIVCPAFLQYRLPITEKWNLGSELILKSCIYIFIYIYMFSIMCTIFPDWNNTRDIGFKYINAVTVFKKKKQNYEKKYSFEWIVLLIAFFAKQKNP